MNEMRKTLKEIVNTANKLTELDNEMERLQMKLRQLSHSYSHFKVCAVNNPANQKMVGRTYSLYNVVLVEEQGTIHVINEQGTRFDFSMVEFLTEEEMFTEEERKVVSLDAYRAKRLKRAA